MRFSLNMCQSSPEMCFVLSLGFNCLFIYYIDMPSFLQGTLYIALSFRILSPQQPCEVRLRGPMSPSDFPVYIGDLKPGLSSPNIRL